MISENRPVRFPVHIGPIPQGNAIVIADSSGNLPPGLNLPDVSAPTVAMRTNPNDPYSKVLIDCRRRRRPGAGCGPGRGSAQRHARTARSQRSTASGCPTSSSPMRAPRWARTDQTIALWDYATADQLQGDGTAPLNVYFRIPPDIYLQRQRAQRHAQPGLSLQLDSHRSHLQHAGAHQQCLSGLGSADSRAGSLAQRCRSMCRFRW